MKIGIPRERKVGESRVALTPKAVSSLIQAKHEVQLESNAGLLSGYDDAAYLAIGATIVFCLEDVYKMDLVLKVKEPAAVPRTASQLLSAAILPYVLKIADQQWPDDAVLQTALAVEDGKIVHPALKNVL